MSRRFPLVLLLMQCATVATAQQLPLDEAIRLALQHNVDVANAKLTVAISDEQVAAFRTKFLPATQFYILGSEHLTNASSVIGKGTLGSYPGIGPIPAKDTSFTTSQQPTGFYIGRVTQPLSSVYQLCLNLRSYKLARDINAQKSRLANQSVVLNVKQIYYQLQEAETSLTATRESIAVYKDTERLAADYVARQVALEPDHLQSQIQLAQARHTELNLLAQISSGKEQLNELMGRDIATDFSMSAIAVDVGTDQDLDDARKRALTQRPELQQAHLSLEQANATLRASRAQYIPSVSAEFDAIGLLNFNPLLPANYLSVGISLSWEPLDWGRKRRQIAEDRDLVIQARNTEMDQRSKVLMDVNDKYRKLALARDQLTVTELEQKNAAEQLRITNSQLRNGTALLNAVLKNQAALAQASSDYQQALDGFAAARADFERATGDDR